VPHLTLEYSANLTTPDDLQGVFEALHEALANLGVGLDDCKSRAYRCESYRVGTGAPERAFVHLTLAMLDRRPEETRAAAGELALAILEDAFAVTSHDCDVTVEVRAMRASGGYFKARIGARDTGGAAAGGPYRDG
jgi:5-carboxymethyl-2-hydroxymuconate isomerase